MNRFVRLQWFLASLIVTVFSLGCSGQSIIPSIPTFPPKPGTSNVPTGSSPMSGDWNTDAEFGHFAFTVDPNGTEVTTAALNLAGWTCGGTTITTQLQVLNSWSISNGEFVGDIDLDSDSNFHTITFNGSYNDTNKQFAGTWQEDSHGTICSGTWAAIPRK